MDSTPAVGAATLPISRSVIAETSQDSTSRDLRVVVAALVVGLTLFQWVDVPLARWLNGSPIPRDLQKVLEAAEHFGTFYGEVLILATLLFLLPGDRHKLARVVATAWIAGLSADVMKLFVARCRPKYFDFTAVTHSHGFLSLLPFGAGGSRHQAFPSAHTATAVGFCVALSHLYPRGRIAFWMLAVLVGLQRMESQSHFASDVIAGALVGWLIGRLMTGDSVIAKQFDRFEAHAP
jgi:membrane-associated phospholipid phosphatase